MAIIFEGNFENDLSDFVNWRKELCCSHSGNIDKSIKHGNNNSFKFILKKKDPDVSTSKRCELSNDTKKDPINSERWYGFSIFIPNDWVNDVMPEIVSQWHATPDKKRDNKYETWRSPPLDLQIIEDKWRIINIWDTKPVTVDNSGESKILWTDKYEKGVWTDWVVHAKWSYESDGLVEVWKNGEKVVTKNGPVCYNDWKGIFWKFGIYKWGWDNPDKKSYCTTRTINHALIKIGDKNSNYNEVAPYSSSTPFPTHSPTPTPTTGSIHCTCNQVANITLNDEDPQTTPHTYHNVPIGMQLVNFSKPNYHINTCWVDVKGGKTQTIYVELKYNPSTSYQITFKSSPQNATIFKIQ